MRLFVAMCAALLVVACGPTAHGASAFGSPAFEQQWQRDEAMTPNFWGPLATAKRDMQEPYKEAQGGQRLVQYFDKGRMELTNGTVTEGLLASEILKGQIQVGDTVFQANPPPALPIAGDPDNPGPTYAAIATTGSVLLSPAQQRLAQAVTSDVSAVGEVSDSGPTGIRSGQTVIGGYDQSTQHNVARAFADYRTKVGLAAIGLAISEPFWTQIKVGGQQRDVMVQIFERRVLTYTQSNPDAFQVEMGNIGQQYYQWRYLTPSEAPIVPSVTTTPMAPESIWKPSLITSWQIQYAALPVDQSVDAQMYDIDLFDNDPGVIAALHAAGRKAVCYFSAGSYEPYRPDGGQFPSAVRGKPINGFEDEQWLDVRRLDILGPIMWARLDLAKQRGCDGVDPDNVDGFTNATGFPLTAEDQLSYNRWLAQQAHGRGLAIGLKNNGEQVSALVADFDWVVVEQCFEYDECEQYAPFIQAGKPVFEIEYNRAPSTFCARANALNFNSLYKHLNLDAYRVSCR